MLNMSIFLSNLAYTLFSYFFHYTHVGLIFPVGDKKNISINFEIRVNEKQCRDGRC